MTESGVSTDIWTSYAARIMVISVFPFLIVQLPQMLNSTSGRHLAVLIALIISVSMFIIYCLYQVLFLFLSLFSLQFTQNFIFIFWNLLSTQYWKIRRSTFTRWSCLNANSNKLTFHANMPCSASKIGSYSNLPESKVYSCNGRVKSFTMYWRT